MSHERPMNEGTRLIWKKFTLMTEACVAFKGKCCIYAIAAPSGVPLYIGASEGKGGLDGRYHGGTAAAVDAALHGSGNVLYVAAVEKGDCVGIERALIYAESKAETRDSLPLYNRRRTFSAFAVGTLLHDGVSPRFRHRHAG